MRMARPIWTGVISFGLVSVPVAMYSATREHEVRFHQFEKGTTDRIRYQRVNERTGKEVDFADIVKGADIGDGELVLLDPDELDAVAPGQSKSMDIYQFVELDEIDPIYFQKTYYLMPGSEETTKTYALLRDAMEQANRAAIATLVMRSKEYLACIRADNGLLVLETMFFADEVRDPHEYRDQLPGRVRARPQELRTAGQLIDSMTGSWKPTDYRDTYTDRVHDLIETKREGGEVEIAAAAPEPTNVVDLMEVLRRSVENARAGRSRSRTRGRKTATKPAAKRATKRSPDPRSLTKADLMKLARRLDIAGRSSMSRAQLEKAVTAAQQAA
jgi:DNA end-binding protein Ku